MTLAAVYCFVSKNAIPKKKEGIMVYYSKKHVDIVKGITAPEEPQYYTVVEALRKGLRADDRRPALGPMHRRPGQSGDARPVCALPHAGKLCGS